MILLKDLIMVQLHYIYITNKYIYHKYKIINKSLRLISEYVSGHRQRKVNFPCPFYSVCDSTIWEPLLICRGFPEFG